MSVAAPAQPMRAGLRAFAQFSGVVAAPWERSLEHLHGLLATADVDWLLGGSVMLAVRGVEVQPRDIDFTLAEMEPTVEALRDLIIDPNPSPRAMARRVVRAGVERDPHRVGGGNQAGSRRA